MSLKPIECANCGAKYRLPETFKSTHAKCKKCGAMIDVAAQREAPAEPEAPAAAAPAAAAPAAAPRETRRPSRSAASSSEGSTTRRRASSRGAAAEDGDEKPTTRSGRSSSRRAGATSASGRRGSSRRGAAEAETEAEEAPRGSRRGGSSRSGSGRGGRSGGRGRSEAKEGGKSKMPLIAGGVGLLAVAIVVVIFVMSGGEDAPGAGEKKVAAGTENTSDNPTITAMRAAAEDLPSDDRAAVQKFLDGAAAGDADAAALSSVSGESVVRLAAESMKIAGADAEATRLAGIADASNLKIDADHRQAVAAVVGELVKSGDAVDASALAERLSSVTAPEAVEETKSKETAPAKPVATKSKKTELNGPEDVFNPKEELQELSWPDFVSEEEQAEITEALADIENGGLAGKRAKGRLDELGAKSLVGIANALREVNYLDSDETMYAYELNRLIGQMTYGVNVGFKSVDLGDEISLETAHWNARTVTAWQRFCELHADPDAYEAMLKARKKK